MAWNNRLWHEHPADAEALFVFQPISSPWYASKALDGKVVPTWNYACVHARGLLKIVDDPGWLLLLLEQLTAHNEKFRCQAWSVSDAPSEYTNKLLAAIVGLVVVITGLQGKWKVSQNRPARDQQSVMPDLKEAARLLWPRSFESAELVLADLSFHPNARQRADYANRSMQISGQRRKGLRNGNTYACIDAAVSAIVDGLACACSRILGKTFSICKDKVRRLAETILMLAFAAFFLVLAAMGAGRES